MTIDYGIDLSCVTDLASDGRMVSGRTLLAEAMARRLSTGRGQLIDDENYGYDLTDYVNDDVSEDDLGAMCAGAALECEKDERVISASCTAVLNVDGSLTVTVTVDDGAGPFDLVLSVSSVTVDLLSVSL